MNSDTQNETVTLSPEESALMADYDRAAREVELQARGALSAIIHLRGLQGTGWTRRGNELVREA